MTLSEADKKQTPVEDKKILENKLDGKTFGYCMIITGLLIESTAMPTNIRILIGILLCIFGWKIARQYSGATK